MQKADRKQRVQNERNFLPTDRRKTKKNQAQHNLPKENEEEDEVGKKYITETREFVAIIL